jgi:uncharacterized RDD family membrane protein YckC
MLGRIAFETPENVLVTYQPAGLGTRFIAWFVDQILLWLILIVISILLLMAGIGALDVAESMMGSLGGADPEDLAAAPLFALGLIVLVVGLGSFAYYGLFEYVLRGQTPGKRSVSIRVVKVDGFSLDAGSVLLRNVFRVVDHIPLLWVVPFVAEKSQRLGDMVAGTVVIVDKPAQMSRLRSQLMERPAEHTQFHFDAATLRRARPEDIEAAEQILERYGELAADQKVEILNTITDALAARLNVEPPPPDQRLTFLIDFLAAEFRRQHRELT